MIVDGERAWELLRDARSIAVVARSMRTTRPWHGVVGYLIGMRTQVVFLSVFSGHVLSVVSMIWFFDFMRELAAAIDSGFGRFAPWIVLALLFGGMVLYRWARGPRAG